MNTGAPTLKEVVLGAFGARTAGLGVVGSLSPLFRAKGLHGRLLAFIFSHLPAIHEQLVASGSSEPHPSESIPAADLTDQQFRALLAHYYRQTIKMLESEVWPAEFVDGPDQAFLKHFVDLRDRDLVEMAATTVELETGSPSVRKITVGQAGWEHLSREMNRLLAEQKISFRGIDPEVDLSGVIARVQMAFLLTLLKEEGRSQAMNTLLGFLQQIQDLGQSGIEPRIVGRMWLLPAQILHEKVESRDEECQRHLDFTSLQAIVCRWRDLLRAPYPKEVALQLCAGNWNSALRLLKGHPHFFMDLRSRLLEMVRLQMPFAEILEGSGGRKRVRLPFEMEVILRSGDRATQMAVASEMLTLLGSQACYPLLCFWQEYAVGTGSLELVDSRPDKMPANGAHRETAVEMILLRFFCQAWGIAGQPTAEDFTDARRLVEAVPHGLEVGAGFAGEIREVLNLGTMSIALSRVENMLDRISLHLPREVGESLSKNVRGLRRLVRKAGVRKKADHSTGAVRRADGQ